MSSCLASISGGLFSAWRFLRIDTVRSSVVSGAQASSRAVVVSVVVVRVVVTAFVDVVVVITVGWCVDRGGNAVGITPGSSFEQPTMGWSPRCYIPSFVEIGLLVPEKKIFEGFFTIYGHGGHLGHVTSIMPIFECTQPWAKVKK